MRLVLASQSPYRKMILSEMGFEFGVEPSDVDESRVKEKDPERLVAALAELKASAVAKSHGNAVVLGADTIVYYNKKAIGKAHSDGEALMILRELLGKKHEVYTGLCAINTITGEKRSVCTKSLVTLKSISDEKLDGYVKGKYYLGKAGCYNIDDPRFSKFIEKIEGCAFNVKGLGIESCKILLNSMGIEPKKS